MRKRLNPDLIAPAALDEAARLSGGVFREMARIMRAAIDRVGSETRIELVHVHSAEAEIRSEYRRILLEERWRHLLKQVHECYRLDAQDPEDAVIIGKLLQMLAILEYNGGDSWWDVHPALIKLLQEYE